jgi:AcrR family transcriptional regulator
MGSGRPRQYATGIARREAIMVAAFEAFGKIGYWNTTLAQIAEDCGVTRAGLLHHFQTKEALLEAVLQRRDELNRGQIFHGTLDPRGNPRDFLQRMVRLVERNASQPGIVNLFTVLAAEATQPEHPAHAYFVNRYSTVRGWLRDALEGLQGCDQLREGVDVERISIELTAVLDGLQVQWLYAPDGVDMPAQFRARVDELLKEPLVDDVPG